MTVKLSGALPAEDTTHNGLEAIRNALLAKPGEAHVVIALVDCVSTTRNHDTGAEIPTARVVQVEAVPSPLEARRLHRQLIQLHAQRTGQQPLFDDDVPM